MNWQRVHAVLTVTLFVFVLLLAHTLRQVSAEFAAQLRHQEYHLSVNRMILLRTIQQIGELHRRDRRAPEAAPPFGSVPDERPRGEYAY